MEKRAVLAIVLSLVVVVLWSIFFAPVPPPPPSEVSEPAPRSSEPRPGLRTPQRQPQQPGVSDFPCQDDGAAPRVSCCSRSVS